MELVGYVRVSVHIAWVFSCCTRTRSQAALNMNKPFFFFGSLVVKMLVYHTGGGGFKSHLE